ncbi:MAG: hypothetical protein Q8K75_04890 [Chlamydiales bacterium]|nr:hypothetical protein [Chlamydiales bacterium]
MKSIEAGTRTLESLKELEIVSKSSQGYFSAAKQIASLEIATLQDATIHGWQTLRDLPSAALNGKLSEQAAHLWYTFAHLTFAAAVPFALVNPVHARRAADALSLRPTGDAKGMASAAKDLSKHLLIQGKKWAARHPYALSSLAAGVSLAGLGLVSSRLQFSPASSTLATSIDASTGNSLSTLATIAGIIILAVAGTKEMQARKPRGPLKFKSLPFSSSVPNNAGSGPLLYKTPLAFPEVPFIPLQPSGKQVMVQPEQFDNIDTIDFGKCEFDSKYTKPYTTSLSRTNYKNEVVWNIKNDKGQLYYLKDDDNGIVVGEDPDPDDNSYHIHEACQRPATSDYIPTNGDMLQQVTYNGQKLLWSRVDGEYQPIGMYSMYTSSRIDVVAIKPENIQDILNSDQTVRTVLDPRVAFAGAELKKYGHQAEYIEFNGQKCPLFVKDQNIAVKIGDSLIPALEFQNVLSFSYQGQNYTSWIQLQALRLEKFINTTPLYKYDPEKNAFIVETIGNNTIIRNPDSDKALLSKSAEFVRISDSNNVIKLATNENCGKLLEFPVALEDVWDETPSLAAASEKGFAYEQSIVHQGETVILRAWPSQHAPQVYLARIGNQIGILSGPLNITTARISLEERFNERNNTDDNINVIMPMGTDGNIVMEINGVEYELCALGDGQFIAKSDKKPYLLANRINPENQTIVLNGSLKSYFMEELSDSDSSD